MIVLPFYRWEYTAYYNAKIFKIAVNFSEIITIQLTSYLNLKPVNWNFVNNQLNVQSSSFSSQPYYWTNHLANILAIVCVYPSSTSLIALAMNSRDRYEIIRLCKI